METETLDRIEQRLRRIEMMLLDLRDNGTRSFMSVDDVSSYTGYSKRYVYYLASEKRIPHYKRDGRLIFKKEEIESWLLENRVSTDSEMTEAAMNYCQTKTNTYK